MEVNQKETTNQFKPKQSPLAGVDAHRAATFSWLTLLSTQKPFEQILKASCERSASDFHPGWCTDGWHQGGDARAWRFILTVWRSEKCDNEHFFLFQSVQHLRLQSDVLRRGGRDGFLLGEPLSGVDRVVGVDCMQRYLRRRSEKQGTNITAFSTTYTVDTLHIGYMVPSFV